VAKIRLLTLSTKAMKILRTAYEPASGSELTEGDERGDQHCVRIKLESRIG